MPLLLYCFTFYKPFFVNIWNHKLKTNTHTHTEKKQAHTYTHTHTLTDIFIYIYMYIYIYIHIHTYIYYLFSLYIYIHIYAHTCYIYTYICCFVYICRLCHSIPVCTAIELVTELLWSCCGCSKRACCHKNIFVIKRIGKLDFLYDYTILQFLVCACWALCVSIYHYERLKVFLLWLRLWMPYREKRYIVQFLFFPGLTQVSFSHNLFIRLGKSSNGFPICLYYLVQLQQWFIISWYDIYLLWTESD